MPDNRRYRLIIAAFPCRRPEILWGSGMKAFASIRVMIFCFCACVALAASVPWFLRVADCSQSGEALVCDQVGTGFLTGFFSDVCAALCGESSGQKSADRQTATGPSGQMKLAAADGELWVADHQVAGRGTETLCVKVQRP